MENPKPPRLLRAIAALLIRGPEAPFILADLDEIMEREVERGMSRWRARWRYAINGLGSAYSVRRRPRLMSLSVLDDVRLALRTLSKDRGFTAVTVLTLAVAIGANTAIFSVVDGILIHPLPYPDADRLVTVATATLPSARRDGNVMHFANPGYWHFVKNNMAFEGFGAYEDAPREFAVFGDGEPLQVEGSRMTPSAFEILGTMPQRGRLPTTEEVGVGTDGPRLVLLSHGLWVTRYGADPSIIGRMIRLDDGQSEVIGVMPEGYDFPTAEIDLWIPLALDPGSRNLQPHNLVGLARLGPGTTLEAAVADAESLIGRLGAVGYPPVFFTSVFSGAAVVRSLKDQLVGDTRRPLLILLGTVGFVLLIACSNVANLFLVRAEARTRDSAVRMALGSGRGRLVRYVLTESVLVALIGGAAGVWLAYLGTRVLVSVGPVSIPRLNEIGVRGSALLYTTGMSVFAGLLFGVLPALHSGSEKMLGALRDGARGTTIGRDRHRARGVLVVIQVALALVLLVGSGLMVRSFQELRAVDPGFKAEGLLTFKILPRATKYRSGVSLAQFYHELIDRLENIPGVTSAGGINWLPLTGAGGRGLGFIEDFPAPEGELPPSFLVRRVTPGYFETMGIPVAEGRSFTTDDDRGRGPLIISQSIKDQYWPNGSALGKRFGGVGRGRIWETIVGVVGNVHAFGLELPADQYMYTPMLGHLETPGRGIAGNRRMRMVVRTEADPLSLVSAVRSAIDSSDPDLPISDIRSMKAVVANSMSRTTFIMSLLVLGAIIGLFLGSVGIYGVISYIVSQRTSEIGLRMALGADSPGIRSLVLKRGMTLAVIGVAVGLVGAAIMSRMLTISLFGISPFDTLTFVGGTTVFLTVAALACIVPAQSAAGVNPADALRSN